MFVVSAYIFSSVDLSDASLLHSLWLTPVMVYHLRDEASLLVYIPSLHRKLECTALSDSLRLRSTPV